MHNRFFSLKYVNENLFPVGSNDHIYQETNNKTTKKRKNINICVALVVHVYSTLYIYLKTSYHHRKYKSLFVWALMKKTLNITKVPSQQGISPLIKENMHSIFKQNSNNDDLVTFKGHKH